MGPRLGSDQGRGGRCRLRDRFTAPRPRLQQQLDLVFREEVADRDDARDINDDAEHLVGLGRITKLGLADDRRGFPGEPPLVAALPPSDGRSPPMRARIAALLRSGPAIPDLDGSVPIERAHLRQEVHDFGSVWPERRCAAGLGPHVLGHDSIMARRG